MDEFSMIDIMEKLAKVAAILVGGAWVYFNAIRGRTFIPRLVPKIKGELKDIDSKQYLLISLQIENVGSSIAKISEKGTGLIIYFQKSIGSNEEAVDLKTTKKMAFAVFNLIDGEERKIEPGTTIYSQELIEVPINQYNAYRLLFRVSSPPTYWFDKMRRKWRAIAVIPNEAINTSQNA
jgi:hypothetical protein